MEECPKCQKFTLYYDYVLKAKRCGNTDCNYSERRLFGYGIDPKILETMRSKKRKEDRG